ncbi:cysteine-rich motor neuron 1 protein-like [Tubulanus polymorphus]|uniref:cysteine-rich motor neuron 1 protein-like n=1 Tax=Tubulanus polymorphus TaxID=672921 RepID=UPI003DA3B199
MKLSTTLGYFLLVVTISGLYFNIDGFTCPEACDELKCVEPVDCPGGVTLDFCACCSECARQENETCGGHFGIFGHCNHSLRCTYEDGFENGGICRKIDKESESSQKERCAHIKCRVVFSPVCPEDSLVHGGNIPDGSCCPSPPRCVCKPCLEQHNCTNGYEKIITKNGTGESGNCCDISECRKMGDKCDHVKCPENEETECPADSVELPNTVSDDGCCEIVHGCKCEKQSNCVAVICKEDELRIEVIPPLVEPGHCCGITECRTNISTNCERDGIIINEGDNIYTDRCTLCTCKNGGLRCQTESCSATSSSCSWMEVRNDSCCPVCKGCTSKSGSTWKNGETWKEDSCTTCRCLDGEAFCQSTGSTANAVQFVMVCINLSIISVPDLCTSLDKCTEVCLHGYMENSQGCAVCQCRPENCSLECPYGFEVDENLNNAELCRCKEGPYECSNISSCNKHCTYGYKSESNGCLTCHCNPCPPFVCQQHCPMGYTQNKDGCSICKCIDPKEQGSNTTEIIPITRQPCIAADGEDIFEDGESWFDGCRHCFCYNGLEMCALIHCPALQCDQPIVKPRDCCPSCPAEKGPLLTRKEQICVSISGNKHYTEGEAWMMDTCTYCVCHRGNTMCDVETCPPVLCQKPVTIKGKCCLSCTEEDPNLGAFLPMPGTPCYSKVHQLHEHGEIWKSNPCQSCTCRHGQIHCYTQSCKQSNCKNSVLKKGQCCPHCIEEDWNSCFDGRDVFGDGEVWIVDKCTVCRCHAKHVTCTHKVCTPPNCKLLVEKPGHCCPVCTGEHYKVNGNITGIEKHGGISDQLHITMVSILVSVIIILMVLIVILVTRLARRDNCFVKQNIKFLNHNHLTTQKTHNHQSRSLLGRPPKSTNLHLQGTDPILNGDKDANNTNSYCKISLGDLDVKYSKNDKSKSKFDDV